MQRNVEERLPSVMKLEEESRALREFHVLDVEVPGQYLNDQVRVEGVKTSSFSVLSWVCITLWRLTSASFSVNESKVQVSHQSFKDVLSGFAS